MNIPEGWPTEEMLEAAKSISGDYGTGLRERIIAALSAAPTPPEVEPVAQIESYCGDLIIARLREDKQATIGGLLYTYPPSPKAEWTGPRYRGDVWMNNERSNFHVELIPDANGELVKFSELQNVKASWDADGNPTNLEAAARDALRHMDEAELDYLKIDARDNLRKFLPGGMRVRITPEQLEALKKPNPETIVDRLMGIYPSAVGSYKPSPLEQEAAGEILRLRAELEDLAKSYCGG